MKYFFLLKTCKIKQYATKKFSTYGYELYRYWPELHNIFTICNEDNYQSSPENLSCENDVKSVTLENKSKY